MGCEGRIERGCMKWALLLIIGLLLLHSTATHAASKRSSPSDENHADTNCKYFATVTPSIKNPSSKTAVQYLHEPGYVFCHFHKNDCTWGNSSGVPLQPTTEVNGTGLFSFDGLKKHYSGRLIPLWTHDKNPLTGMVSLSDDACSGNMVNPPKLGLHWIALIQRGNCKFEQKIQKALKYNASAVIVFDGKSSDPDTLTVMTHTTTNIVTIMILHDQGMGLQRMAQVGNTTGEQLYVDITYTYMKCVEDAQNSATIMVVAITFIVVMMASLAWFVFYYIQRHRNTNKSDRMRERLEKAVCKALKRLGERTLLEGDEETKGEDGDGCTYCLEGYQPGEIIRELPCSHKFHKICVDVWLIEHRTCPNCKDNLLLSVGHTMKGVGNHEQSPQVEVEAVMGLEPNVQIIDESRQFLPRDSQAEN